MRIPRILPFIAAVCVPGLILAPSALGQNLGVKLLTLPLPVPRKVDFEKEVYPIFKTSCFKCHGPEKQKGKYRMDTREGAFKETSEHGPAIKAGDSEKSAIILMVAGQIDEMLMPPPGGKPGESDPLTVEQIGILRAWIDQGAVWPEGPIKEEVKLVGFETDIKPVLTTACAKCHSGAEAEGKFSVESLDAVLAGGKGYGKVIAPGDPAKSSLITIITGKDEDIPKPEVHKLTAKEVGAVTEWIKQGAK